MHVHVQPRSEFTCHSCSLSRDCQEMNHSPSRTFVECSEQPGKSYNHPVVTPSRPAVGPTWKGLPCAGFTFLISRRLVVGTFPVCHPLPLMPTPRCKFTPLRSSIWRCARLALLCLLALAAGCLRADRRPRDKCLRATWRGLQPSRPASGLRTRMRAGAGGVRSPPRVAIRLHPALHTPALHAPPLRRAARPS